MAKTLRRINRKDARTAYVEAELVNGLAAQIRANRKRRNWSQAALAERIGTTQNVVSRLEDPSYGRYSIKSLLKLAEVFDVALIARFVPHSTLVAATWDTRPAALEVASYEEDIANLAAMEASAFVNVNVPSSAGPRYLLNEADLRFQANWFWSKKFPADVPDQSPPGLVQVSGGTIQGVGGNQIDLEE